MIKKVVKYEDLDENIIEDTLYFNLNQNEMYDLMEEYPDGLEAEIDRIKAMTNVNAQEKEYRAFMTNFITRSYGIRREDNKGLSKSKQISDDFRISPAWDALMDSLKSPADGLMFIMGIMPKIVQNNPQAQAQFKEVLRQAEEIKEEATAAPAAPTLPPPPVAS